jgi:hypothetical protein
MLPERKEDPSLNMYGIMVPMACIMIPIILTALGIGVYLGMFLDNMSEAVTGKPFNESDKEYTHLMIATFEKVKVLSVNEIKLPSRLAKSISRQADFTDRYNVNFSGPDWSCGYTLRDAASVTKVHSVVDRKLRSLKGQSEMNIALK